MEINEQLPDGYPYLPGQQPDEADSPYEAIAPHDYLIIHADEPDTLQQVESESEGTETADQPLYALDKTKEAYDHDSGRAVHESLHFKVLDDNPWTTQNLEKHLRVMGAPDPHVTEEDVDSFRNCYDQSPQNRIYHGIGHSVDMGQEDLPDMLLGRLQYMTPAQARAISAFSGLIHDIAYKHVDELDDTGRRAWPSSLERYIDGQATYERAVEDDKVVYRTYVTPPQAALLSPKEHATQIAADISGVEDGVIKHKQGGNEFDSALAGAQYLTAQQVPEWAVIATDACVAATYPFQPAVHVDPRGVVSDGHMGELARRVHAALVQTGAVPEETAWGYTNDIMLIGVQLANRDVENFIVPDNFAAAVRGGRGVKAEEVPELRNRVSNIGELALAAGLQRSAPLLYGWLGSDSPTVPVPAEHVPHVYIPRTVDGKLMGPDTAYPPLAIYGEAVRNTTTNARMANTFFTIHELSIKFMRAAASLVDEPGATVPGIVNESRWPKEPIIPPGQLNREDSIIHHELHYAESQQKIDSATPARSPIAAVMFGVLGSEGTATLSEYLHNMEAEAGEHEDVLADPVAAAQYVAKVRAGIGEEAFGAIIRQSQRIAEYYRDDPERGNPDRAQKLAQLMEMPARPQELDT